MKRLPDNKQPRLYRLARIAILMTVMIFPVSAGAHGGKNHGANQFTALQALQKATGMYDKLIGMGKLSEEWEIGLVQVRIAKRDRDGIEETVVSFSRSGSSPQAVHFFFKSDGTYAGSNFTGE